MNTKLVASARESSREPFIDIDGALQLLPGFTREHLAKMRFDGTGPAFYKPSKRTVLYRASDIYKWLEGTKCTSTAGYRGDAE